MSWTAERLDALPEGTVVEWEGAYYSWALHDTPGSLYGWLSDSGEKWSSAEIVKSSEGSINPKPATVGLGEVDPTSAGALVAIRAAIAHVIGGEHG